MLRSLMLSAALGFSALLTTPALAQWTRIPGSEGLMVNAMLKTDGMIYVGTQSSGTWLYSGDGAGFRKSTLTTQTDNFAVAGTKIYAGTTNGVWMSSDKGATWKRLGNFEADESVLSLAVSGDTLYAGTFLGLYMSVDGGAKWARTGGSMVTDWVESVAASGSLVYAGSGSGFGGTTLYKSEDAGKSWKAAEWPGRGREIDGIRFLDRKLFIASTSGINYSPDRGATWTMSEAQSLAFTTKSFFSSVLDYSDGALFFTHGGDKEWISQDSGSNWSYVAKPVFAARRYAISGDTLFCGAQDGVYQAALKASLPVLPREARLGAARERNRVVRYAPGRMLAIAAGWDGMATGIDGRSVAIPLK